ncbi:hypothetical protein BC936DRAFT_146344 [Jimgerdemannia flammicorona]|uniref:RING-type domain-containing protein n=1 Tax=Jimgerdemannia flammicorona TaxID=994334 RepID=A0A433D7U3_9FUNG|nr:hypothetical protein BC936DRAFT_146344 [Jimgerdemannia flammicorona]
MSRPGSSKAAISTTAAAASALSADSEDSEFLQCFICYEDLKKATLCPSCSKLACEDCLYKWLAQESKCPHCRSKLEVGQLVRARFIDELQQVWRAIDAWFGVMPTTHVSSAPPLPQSPRRSPPTKKSSPKKRALRMPGHPLPTIADNAVLRYAPTVACLVTTRYGHGFESLQAAYNRHKEELTERKLPAAHESLQRYNDAAVELGKNIQKCKEAKAKVENELNLTFEGIRMKLDSKFQAKKMLLNNHLTPLTDAKKSLRDRIAKLEASLKRDPPAVMMRRLGEMTRSLEKAQKFKPQAYVVDPTIEAWFMPKYTEARVTVPGFRERCLEKETFKSAIMTVYGVSWRLKVYCGGNEQAKDKYVSVFVELVSSVFPNSREEYQYRIELVSWDKHPSGAPDAPKSIVRDYAKTFAVNETWGWYNFVSLEKLREDGFLDAENELSFVYGVRPVDAEQQAALKERYIKYLEQKVDRLEYPELNSIPLSKRAKEKSTSTDSKVTIEIDDDDDDVVLNEDVSNNIKLEYPSDRKGICSRSIDEVDDDSGGVGPSKVCREKRTMLCVFSPFIAHTMSFSSSPPAPPHRFPHISSHPLPHARGLDSVLDHTHLEARHAGPGSAIPLPNRALAGSSTFVGLARGRRRAHPVALASHFQRRSRSWGGGNGGA